MENNKTIRYKLLPYQALARRWLIPAILMIPAGFGFWWGVQRLDPQNRVNANLGWLISITGILLTLYAVLAFNSHVSFHADHFTLHPPIHPMAISYKRIKLVHPIEFRMLFSPQKAKNSQYRLYRKIWGKTVPVVIIDGFPLPRWWLKLWFHPFLLHPDENGILLVVDDWMGCSRTLDSMRTGAAKKHR